MDTATAYREKCKDNLKFSTTYTHRGDPQILCNNVTDDPYVETTIDGVQGQPWPICIIENCRSQIAPTYIRFCRFCLAGPLHIGHERTHVNEAHPYIDDDDWDSSDDDTSESNQPSHHDQLLVRPNGLVMMATRGDAQENIDTTDHSHHVSS